VSGPIAPLVSIGLPVFNGENYIEVALKSIVSQDYDDFELIISDNASTDRTESICRDFAAGDRRIRYSRAEANRGAAPNYQRAFELSRGTYFKWAAHDDVCLPGFLNRCVAEISRTDSSVVLVYPRAEIIDAAGNVCGVDDECVALDDSRPHRRAVYVLRRVNLGWAQFGLMRSDALKKTRLIDGFIGSDYVLLAELAMLGRLLEIHDVLFQRRVHAGMSNVAHASENQWLEWLDSSNVGSNAQLPAWVRIGVECIKSARRMPLAQHDRAMCIATVPTAWYLRKMRDLGGRLKRRLREGLTPQERT
jgi:glycosyltransferase involved in cell wall biosynthesis